jgi:hypothetical protein
MTQQPSSPNPTSRPFGRESAPRLADFTADLLWPRLLQSVSLALKPERIGIAFFGLVAAMAIGSIAEAWDKQNSTLFVLNALASSFSAIAAGVFGLDAADVAAGIGGILALPRQVWAEYGWATVLLHVPALWILAVAGCAISRMAACDFSQGVVLSWTEGLSFAIRKAGSIFTAVVTPLAVVALIAAGIAVVGAILGWPAVNILGAILYGLFLLGSAIAVVLLACWGLGLPLLIPAIACEGTDGLDAIQRAYAYVLGRPVRLLAFAAIALLIGWAASLVAALFAGATTGFAEWAATGLSGPDGHAIISGPAPGAPALEGPSAFAAHIIHFWLAIPVTLVWSIALSLYFCASTVVYLLIRQVCDGQDSGELWMPGMIEATMAQAMRARASVAGLTDPEAPTRIGIPDSGRRERTASDDDDDA